MSAATDFLEGELLDHILNSLGWASPTSVQVGLSTTTPNEDGTNFTEPADTYAKQTPGGSPPFTVAAGGGDETQATNAQIIEFPEATASWGTLTHFGIFDHLGNLLVFAALTSPIAVGAGETVRFPIGELKVTLD